MWRLQISILKILFVANFYIANFPLTGRLAKLSLKYIGGSAKCSEHNATGFGRKCVVLCSMCLNQMLSQIGSGAPTTV